MTTTNPTPADTIEAAYTGKSWTYTHDPAFTSSVVNYLRVNAAEWAEQADAATPGSCKQFVCQARRDAYLDAVRVLTDADDAAYAWIEQHAVALPPANPFTFDVGV